MPDTEPDETEPALVLPLPEGWVRTDFDADTMAGLERCLELAGPMLGEAGFPVDSLGRMLREFGADPRLEDVRFAAAWLHVEDDGGVVQANVSITTVPGEVRAVLADDPVWDLTMLTHPSGEAVVRRTRTKTIDQPLPVLGGGAAGLDEIFGPMMGVAEYVRAVPGTTQLALLTFTSATLGAWRHLLTLFDNMVLASEWVTVDPAAFMDASTPR